VLPHHKTDRAAGTPRLIPLRPVLLRLLRWVWRRRGCPATGHVWLSGRGTPWTRAQLDRRFAEYRELAGVRKEVVLYSCRHGFAVNGIKRGLPDRAIADVLGHQNLAYLSWYGRSTRQDAAHLRSVAEQVLGGPVPPGGPAIPAAPLAGEAPTPPALPVGGCKAAIVDWLAAAADGWHTLDDVQAGLVAGGGRWSLETARALLGELVKSGHLEAQGRPRSYRCLHPEGGAA
jgi:hypothetical protein